MSVDDTLRECLGVRNAILSDVKQLSVIPEIREYLRPVRAEHGQIYREEALYSDSGKGTSSHEPKLAFRLFPLARTLWRFWQAVPGCDLAECKRKVGPWLTFVIVDQTDLTRRAETGRLQPVYHFHSFGIAEGMDPDRWYDFLEEQQQSRSAEQTFILSSLFYSDWFPTKASPALSFRIWFSPHVGSFPTHQQGVIELFIEAPDKQPWPLRLECDKDCSYTKSRYTKWRKEIERAKGEGNLYEGVRTYIDTINQYMGSDGSEWVLHGFPVPAFGKREPSSGLYLATAPVCVQCAGHLEDIAFLVSSALWPLDHLWRQRALQRKTEELKDWRRHFRRVVRFTSASQQKIRAQLEGVVRNDRSDHARFRDFIDTLGYLPCDTPFPKLMREMRNLCSRLDLSPKFQEMVFTGTEDARRVIDEHNNMSFKHLVRVKHKGAGARLAKAFSSALEGICREILPLWRFDREVSAFPEMLSQQFGRTCNASGVVWPLAMVFDSDVGVTKRQVEVCLKEVLQVGNARISVDAISSVARAWELPLLAFLAATLFQMEAEERQPNPEDPTITVIRTATEWQLIWRGASATDRRARNLLREGEQGLLHRNDHLPTNGDKVRQRAVFIGDLLGLSAKNGKLSIEETNGVWIFRARFGRSRE